MNRTDNKIILFHDPIKYFDKLLSLYMYEKRSLLFSEEMIIMAKEKSPNDFFLWLDDLNFMPLYNPQTFFFDDKKRVDIAKEKIAQSDYVVIEKDLKYFEKKTGICVVYDLEMNSKLPPVSLADAEEKLQKQFIGKDLQLYDYVCELWEKIEMSGYKQLGEIIKRYRPIEDTDSLHGVIGMMNENLIRGFVFNSGTQESLELEIYQNNMLLIKTVANKPRPEVKDKFDLKTNKCGILVKFDKPTIKPGDKIEVVIVPDNVLVPIVGSAKAFLEGE